MLCDLRREQRQLIETTCTPRNSLDTWRLGHRATCDCLNDSYTRYELSLLLILFLCSRSLLYRLVEGTTTPLKSTTQRCREDEMKNHVTLNTGVNEQATRDTDGYYRVLDTFFYILIYLFISYSSVYIYNFARKNAPRSVDLRHVLLLTLKIA